jgi:hypothetical protein
VEIMMALVLKLKTGRCKQSNNSSTSTSVGVEKQLDHNGILPVSQEGEENWEGEGGSRLIPQTVSQTTSVVNIVSSKDIPISEDSFYGTDIDNNMEGIVGSEYGEDEASLCACITGQPQKLMFSLCQALVLVGNVDARAMHDNNNSSCEAEMGGNLATVVMSGINDSEKNRMRRLLRVKVILAAMLRYSTTKVCDITLTLHILCTFCCLYSHFFI